MSETPEALQLDQEPQQEKVLVFSDEKARRYAVFVNGELEVSLLSSGPFVFAKEPGKPMKRAHHSSSWECGSMVLANQGGLWVMTADPDEDVDVLNELSTKQDRADVRALIAEVLKGKPMPEEQSRVRSAAFAMFLAGVAGVTAGTSFFIMEEGHRELSSIVDHLSRLYSSQFTGWQQ